MTRWEPPTKPLHSRCRRRRLPMCATRRRSSTRPTHGHPDAMTSGGAEALKAAIRRSLLLILLLVLLGVVAVNAFKQLRGPRYQANARVLISTTSLAQIITQTVPPFVDPNRIEATARALAGSPEVYKLAAQRVGNSLGTPGEMGAATS